MQTWFEILKEYYNKRLLGEMMAGSNGLNRSNLLNEQKTSTGLGKISSSKEDLKEIQKGVLLCGQINFQGYNYCLQFVAYKSSGSSTCLTDETAWINFVVTPGAHS